MLALGLPFCSSLSRTRTPAFACNNFVLHAVIFWRDLIIFWLSFYLIKFSASFGRGPAVQVVALPPATGSR